MARATLLRLLAVPLLAAGVVVALADVKADAASKAKDAVDPSAEASRNAGNLTALSGGGGGGGETVETICNEGTSPFADKTQRTIACYVSNFLLKTLSEVIEKQPKTAMHVRMQLLPYLGGAKLLDGLGSQTSADPECTVCYTNTEIQTQLNDLRAALPDKTMAAYDKLKVCYATLTDRLMNELPKSEDGVSLVPHPLFEVDPGKEVVGMLKAIFINHNYDDVSCRLARGAGGHLGAHPHSGKHGGKGDHGASEALRGLGRRVGRLRVPKNMEAVKNLVGVGSNEEKVGERASKDKAGQTTTIIDSLQKGAKQVQEVVGQLLGSEQPPPADGAQPAPPANADAAAGATDGDKKEEDKKVGDKPEGDKSKDAH